MMTAMKGAKKTGSESGSTIRLPQEVWDAVDEDARRCVRSRNGQIEAILRVYYNLTNIELIDLSDTRAIVSPHLSDKSQWKVPIVEANQNDKTTERKKTKDDRHRKAK